MKITLAYIIFLLSYQVIFSQEIKVTSAQINSNRSDFNSNITNNGRIIYLTSERKDGYQKVYITEKSKGEWTEPVLAFGGINNGMQTGAVALTTDGQLMLFAAYDHDVGSFGRTDIFSAEKVYGRWTNIKNLGPKINSKSWDSQPMISNDGNILLFSSDREGGYGGNDIYMSIKEKGIWSQAINLGPTINTEFDEVTPVLGVDNVFFTFASNRPGGFGGFDIYIATYQNNMFPYPENAGEPINSIADDYYFYAMPNSEDAYLSSSKAGGDGELDIYKVHPNPYKSRAVMLLNGIVKDAKNGFPLGSNIVITDLRTGQKVAELRSDDNTGEYYVVLQQDGVFSITAEKDGYLFFSEKYEVPYSLIGQFVTKDILLSPIKNGNTRLLIFFDYNKYELKSESIPELDRMVTFLQKNDSLNIMVEGHTDDIGFHDFNKKLSEDRAGAVRNYLINNGINPNRISIFGYGFSKPLLNGKTEEDRAGNRRVEARILSK